jgi:hypothetical protein
MSGSANGGRALFRAFSLAFSFWVIAQRYDGSFNTAASVWGFTQLIMSGLIYLSALGLVGVSTYSFVRLRSFPNNALFLFGSLLGVELLWRLLIYDLPGYGFKLVALAVYAGQPVVAALGVASLTSIARSLPASAGHKRPNN